MGPKVGYYSPESLVEYEVHDHYRYRGRCVALTHRDQVLQTPVSPLDPTTTPSTVTLRTMRSVRAGPRLRHRRWPPLRPDAVHRRQRPRHPVTRRLPAARRGRRQGPHDFVRARRHYTGNENWFYVHGQHIAWLQSGWFPRHAPGTDLELPIRGTGPWDWQGFVPSTGAFARQADSFNPMSIDPAQGYLSSWNNKGAEGWRAAPGIWSYGRVHRDELLRDPVVRAIKAGRRLTLADVVGISGNASTQDLRGVEVLPDLLRTLGTPTNPTQRRLVASLRTWVHKGAHRRDTTGKGWYDDSAAVMAFDTWWRQLVHDLYDPLAGKDVVTLLQQGIDLVLDGRAVQTGFYDGCSARSATWSAPRWAPDPGCGPAPAAPGPSRPAAPCSGGRWAPPSPPSSAPTAATRGRGASRCSARGTRPRAATRTGRSRPARWRRRVSRSRTGGRSTRRWRCGEWAILDSNQ